MRPEHIVKVPDNFGGAEHEVIVFDEAVMQYVSRLRKLAKAKRKWSKKNEIACYRIYDADLPEYSAAIDIYINLEKDALDNPHASASRGGATDSAVSLCALSDLSNEELCRRTYVHIAEYQAPSSIDPRKASQRFYDLVKVTPDALGIPKSHLFVKVRKRDKGGSQYSENRKPFVFCTKETGLTFKVDMNGYLDTGLFLDHRVTRELVQKLSKGKRVLNLFSYTGSATVHAAAGGALVTMTVDLSQTYLDWARENMALNGFDGKTHLYQRGDTMSWLLAADKKGYNFDLIFVDPPTFSNSKAMGKATWDVQRDHLELLRRCASVLSPNGTIIFSCNLRSFKIDLEGLADCGLSVEDITAETIPEDFARNPKIHKCFVLKNADRS